MIKTVILDWSGVLCDDLSDIYKAEMGVFKHFGLKPISLEEYRDIAELPWKSFYRKRSIEDFEKVTEVFLSGLSANGIAGKPMPGAGEALKWMHDRGIKLAVLSAKSREFLVKECKVFGFDGMISEIERIEDKRNAINLLVARLGSEKENALFAGDMVHDIETAKHAGIKSVAVLSGYDTREKLEKAKPDFILHDISQLPALIEKLDGDTE